MIVKKTKEWLKNPTPVTMCNPLIYLPFLNVFFSFVNVSVLCGLLYVIVLNMNRFYDACLRIAYAN